MGPTLWPAWDGLGSLWFMDGDFANIEPLLPMVDAAQHVLGRKVPRLGAPYSADDLRDIAEIRKDLALVWSRLQECQDPAQQQRLKRKHRMVNRQLQRFRSKARSRFVRTLCAEAEQHIRYHDMGRSYTSLKKIGVHLLEFTVAGKGERDLFARCSHCQTVSGAEHVPFGTVAHWLRNTPSPDEVHLAVRRLRDCSPGRDEVTAGMLKWAGPRATECVISIIQSLWVSQKGGRQDLGNYRVVMLLPKISRVLARIVATRLQHWSETKHFLRSFHWASRRFSHCFWK